MSRFLGRISQYNAEAQFTYQLLEGIVSTPLADMKKCGRSMDLINGLLRNGRGSFLSGLSDNELQFEFSLDDTVEFGQYKISRKHRMCKSYGENNTRLTLLDIHKVQHNGSERSFSYLGTFGIRYSRDSETYLALKPHELKRTLNGRQFQ